MLMRQRIAISSFVLMFSMMLFCGCQENYVVYSDAEYIMFADTAAFYPVQKDVEYIKIPVVSTVRRDYDRVVAVEVIDKGSNAKENHHYTLASNTVTIKAGQTRADVLVHGIYDNIEAEDSLGFTLSLVMHDKLEMELYGKTTKVTLMKSCPFDMNGFSGWCMLTSMFLYQYGGLTYQRLIYTEPVEGKENVIICRNWLADGYDVRLVFDTEDPMKPYVEVPEGQVASDGGSIFGMIHGDDKLRVRTSPYYDSIFYPCGNYLTLGTEMYFEDLGSAYGTVGHFYNIMEWVSDEEAERLQREEGM